MNNEATQKLPSGGAEREAREWLENYCDKRLGKGQRPCGWPNFGSIRVDEVVVMLAAYANDARLEALEQAACEIDKCNQEGPYQAIAGAERIRALKAAQHGEKELRKAQ